LRILNHPILGSFQPPGKKVSIIFNGKKIDAYEGEMIVAALMGAGIKVFRFTTRKGDPRGIFCAIGRCTDCVMEVNGKPNVRTCVTPITANMVVNVQQGLGSWGYDWGAK